MRISDTTMQILKNFATINANLLIRPGNRLTSIATTQSVLGTAEVAETFPEEVPIYDLPNFLSVLSMDKGADLEFCGDHVMITANGGTIKYKYADASLLTAPPENVQIQLEVLFDFSITAKELADMKKVSSLIGASVMSSEKSTIMSIKCDGEKSTILIGNPTKPDANQYSREIGETDVVLRADLDMARVNFVPDDYDVAVCNPAFVYFKGKNGGVEYYVSLETSSELNG